MLAGGPMQVYRARNPKKSPLWQCVHRHYDLILRVWHVDPLRMNFNCFNWRKIN